MTGEGGRGVEDGDERVQGGVARVGGGNDGIIRFIREEGVGKKDNKKN
jgi:hypothetical protein